MNIIETNLKFTNSMTNRSTTNRMILHHAEASHCTAEDIHRWHLNNGWAGAGYHFLVRKDGSIYRLRPENKVGAHAQGANSDSIGICFEGSYMTETMPQAQINAGKELVAYLKKKYNISKVQAHRDVCSTSCPGPNFPFAEIAGAAAASTPVNTASKPTTSAPTKATVKGNGWIARVQAECNKQGFSNQTVDGIAGKNTLAGCPTMRKGAKGNLTALLQEKLNATWYNCGKIDGIFGSGTENAVKALQKAHGLTQDGIVGQKTWRVLLGM
nr:N-acetylmuramoyl-L-alanine amidase [uncultured Dorea sp.]